MGLFLCEECGYRIQHGAYFKSCPVCQEEETVPAKNVKKLKLDKPVEKKRLRKAKLASQYRRFIQKGFFRETDLHGI